MSTVLCGHCKEVYNATEKVCPNCGNAPKIFICNHCGSIYGAGEIRCHSCSKAVDHSAMVPASPEALQAEYEKACDQLAHATNTNQLEQLAYHFTLLSGFYDISQQMQQISTLLGTFRIAEQQEQAYAQLRADLSLPLDADSLEYCASQLTHLGAYKEAPALLDHVQLKIRQNQFNAAELLREKADTPEAWIAAAEAFEALGNFSDAPAQAKACREKATKKHKPRRKHRRIVLISAASLLLAVALAFSTAFIFAPMAFYSQGQRQLEAGQYAQAEASFRKAGKFRNAPAKVDESIRASYYAEGMALIAQGNYLEGAQQLQASGGFLSAEAQILNAGVELVKQHQYDTAIAVFEYSSDSRKDSYISYATGMKAMNNKNYQTAVAHLKEASQLQEAAEKLQEAAYAYGLQCLAKGDFVTANDQFSPLGNYQQAKELSLLCVAEISLTQGHLNTASNAYTAIENSLKLDGLSIADRVAGLTELADFVAICGAWTPSEYSLETKQVNSSTGNQETWRNDNTNQIPNQIVEILCVPQKDGTVTVKGSVTFRHFTNFAETAEACTSQSATKAFEVKGLTSVPQTIQVDDNTVLTITDGVISLEYSKQETVSDSYYNVYTSKLTYDTLSEAY